MIHLFARWNDARRTLGPPDKVLWLFDFDGTLSPIARHPRQVVLPKVTRRLLRKIAQRFPGHVGVLSGRPMKQLKEKIGIQELIYAGTHGFEIRGPGIHMTSSLSTRQQKHIRGLAQQIQPLLKGIPGFWLEDKRWTLCVHYREVKPKDMPTIRFVLQEINRMAHAVGFSVQKGLKTVEIFPDSRRNKGDALRRLQHRLRARGVFYVGDETTDETAFRALGKHGLGVRIGRSASSDAPYYITRQEESSELLRRILYL